MRYQYNVEVTKIHLVDSDHELSHDEMLSILKNDDSKGFGSMSSHFRIVHEVRINDYSYPENYSHNAVIRGKD